MNEFDEAIKIFLVEGTERLLDLLSIFDKDEFGYAFDLVLWADLPVSIFINIDLDDGPFTLGLILFFVENGWKLFAGSTPWGSELDDMVGVGFGGGLEFVKVFDFDEEASGSVKGSSKHW